MCLHAGYDPHGDETTYGLGQGAPRGVPLHRTAPYQVRSASSPPAIQQRRFAIAKLRIVRAPSLPRASL
jgi:hypothetical protein